VTANTVRALLVTASIALPAALGAGAEQNAAPAAPAPATPPPASAQPPSGLVFGSDAAIVINPIRADRVAQFEMVVGRLREALRRSADPVRQRQAASWRVLKASERGPDGAVLYLYVIDPPVPGADYTVSHILAEAFPAEVDALWTALRDSYLGAMHLLTLQTVPEPPPSPGGGTGN
jgi:hypothetical protein